MKDGLTIFLPFLLYKHRKAISQALLDSSGRCTLGDNGPFCFSCIQISYKNYLLLTHHLFFTGFSASNSRLGSCDRSSWKGKWTLPGTKMPVFSLSFKLKILKYWEPSSQERKGVGLVSLNCIFTYCAWLNTLSFFLSPRIKLPYPASLVARWRCYKVTKSDQWDESRRVMWQLLGTFLKPGQSESCSQLSCHLNANSWTMGDKGSFLGCQRDTEGAWF